MTLAQHFRMLSRYNTVANARLFESCAALTDAEYRKNRPGSFGSIHALLNHILFGDRLWMERFQGRGGITPPLNTILYDDFSGLWAARTEQDAAIEDYFAHLPSSFAELSISYVNNQSRNYVESAPVACSHFFNHQTHHRGQVHVMLSQSGVAPPSLDLHRIVNP